MSTRFDTAAVIEDVRHAVAHEEENVVLVWVSWGCGVVAASVLGERMHLSVNETCGPLLR